MHKDYFAFESEFVRLKAEIEALRKKSDDLVRRMQALTNRLDKKQAAAMNAISPRKRV